MNPLDSDIPVEVLQIGKINFNEASRIPYVWYDRLRLPQTSRQKKENKKGNVNLPAIMVLAEICYWYTPTIIRDEDDPTRTIVKKKFKLDKLQRSYSSFESLGLTRKQAADACQYLKKLGLITLESRTIEYGGVKFTNQLFIGINPKEINTLTCVDSGAPGSATPLRPGSVTLALPGDDLTPGSATPYIGEEKEKDLGRTQDPNGGQIPPEPEPEPDPTPKRRACSIDPDWQISERLKTSILEKICSDLHDEEFSARRDVFVDFWISKAGTKDGRKTDWDATFRNHIRAYIANQRWKTKYGKPKPAAAGGNKILDRILRDS